MVICCCVWPLSKKIELSQLLMILPTPTRDCGQGNGEQNRDERTRRGDENTFFGKLVWQPDGDRLAYLRVHVTSLESSQNSIETRTLQDAEATTILSDPQGLVQDFCYRPEG